MRHRCEELILRALGLVRLLERLDRLPVQALAVGGVLFLILETPDERAIRAVRDVHRCDHQDREPVIAALHDDGGRRAGRRGDDEADAAPQELLAPYAPDRAAGRQRNRRSDEAGVDREVRGDGADERLGERGEIGPLRLPAERGVGESGRDHRDRLGGGAEDRAIDRIRSLDVERALRPRADDGDDHRVARAKEQQRHQVGGVRHRQRRSTREMNRKVHLPRRREARRDEQADEERRPRVGRREEGDDLRRADGDHGGDVELRRWRQRAPSESVAH